MKFKHFCERSAIMGVQLASLSLQGWIRENIKAISDLSFLASLILISLHFEDECEAIGPSRLANTLGFSRSRTSQELSELSKKGYIKRSLNPRNARAIQVRLTPSGSRKALDLIKGYMALQNVIDEAIGEKHAEAINKSLIAVHKALMT